MRTHGAKNLNSREEIYKAEVKEAKEKLKIVGQQKDEAKAEVKELKAENRELKETIKDLQTNKK